ncbi:host nuclease inhibitor protein [Ochrobactrum sp. XJ1]|nr:host nuclease inhibitor protein [Ochrobactrum sp. XJ1]
MRAYCYRSGEIGFGNSTPQRALELAHSRRSRELRKIIEINARHGKTGSILLVPGVPEADSDTEALEACLRFKKLVAMRLAGEKGWPAAIPREDCSNGDT